MKLFDDYLPLDGEYDMRRDTTGMPEALATKINSNICMGGGGGGQTQTSGVDAEFKPYITSLLGNLTDDVDRKLSGEEEIVAVFDPRQKDSLNYATATATDQIKGRGAYDMRRANKNALEGLYGKSRVAGASNGSLGSARFQRSMNAGLGDLAGQQQRERQQSQTQGIDRLGKAGTAYQKQSQNVLDGKGNLIKGALNAVTGAGGKTTTTSGGGK
jgi:hypothetical protein